MSSSQSDDNYYVYYGNSSASNPPATWSNVFLLYDDFNDGSLDTGRWSNNRGTCSESGGTLSLSTRSSIYAQPSYALGADTSWEARVQQASIANGESLNYLSASSDADYTTGSGGDSWARCYAYRSGSTSHYLQNALGGTTSSVTYTPTTPTSFHVYSFQRRGTSSVNYYQDTTALTNPSGSIPTANLRMLLWNDSDQANGLIYDWVRVRNYVNPEPTASIGSREGRFEYRRKITVNYSQRGTGCGSSFSLPDFPLLISLSHSTLKTKPNGGHVYSSSGHDIIFRASDDLTQLDHEIEKYDGGSTGGTLVAWVRIPALFENSQDTVIYMYYGNAAVSSSLENSTGVWDSNCKAVWHLQNSTGSTVTDSTTTPNNGAPQNSPTQSAGKVDGSLNYNGFSHYVTVSDSSDLQLSSSMSISAWVRTTSTDNQARLIVAKWQGGSPAKKNYWFGKYYTTSIAFYVDGTQAVTANLSLITDGYWHQVVAVADAGNLLLRLYVDGSQVSSAAYTGSSQTGDSGLEIGRSPDDGTQLWSGDLDDVRIANIAREPCWIETEYNNQNNPGNIGASGFYSVDDESWPAPTAIDLACLSASARDGHVLVQWKTGRETNNLGFHVWQDLRGEWVRITPSLISGSALLVGEKVSLLSGRTYAWRDPAPAMHPLPRYWIEEVDLNGARRLYGPAEVQVMHGSPHAARAHPEESSPLLGARDRSERHQGSSATAKARTTSRHAGRTSPTPQDAGERLGKPAPSRGASRARGRRPMDLAGGDAIKLIVADEGWYRVGQPALIAAGLDPGVDPRRLRLFAAGTEVPLRILGTREGTFNPSDAIEFYGRGRDTPSTDCRTYWLIEDSGPGKRIGTYRPSRWSSLAPRSFLATVELKERKTYFAALRNGDADNFFGSILSTEGVDQSVILKHLDHASPGDARLEISLQGVTTLSHQVQVLLNGTEVAEATFLGQTRGNAAVQVPQSLLLKGENTVTLVPLGGETDVSLLDRIRISYWHTYTADDDILRFPARGGQVVTVEGFTTPRIRVVDVTAPEAVVQVACQVVRRLSGYAARVHVPGGTERTLFAFADDAAKEPREIRANLPSDWHEETGGADMLMISHGDFIESLKPLTSLRESQGLSVAVADVEDLYDEFNFGEKSPKAIKDFLRRVCTTWKTPPRFVLLVGDASVDPRDYLKLGKLDLVPTKLVDTAYLETASDDWFVDFAERGLPAPAIGRLPVSTVEEAHILVSKIIGYEAERGEGWRNRALLVAGRNDGFDFERASAAVKSLLPGGLLLREICEGHADGSSARNELLESLLEGNLLINYMGHGSVETWRGDLLDSDDARGLTNARRLPIVISMTCLNGFFHDVYADCLAEALLKAPQGGAIAVWASSGLTEPEGQADMDREFLGLLFGEAGLTIGEAAARAKGAVSDTDIRRTWIFFGDPSIRP